jgi:glycosyltransferase involved in cell wall biosynthesis
MRLAKIVFWGSAAALLHTQLGYGGTLLALSRARGPRGGPLATTGEENLPSVSVVIAAYAEESVIQERVANLRALDYPRDRLQVIVACDGSPDATAARARAAGADAVLELARGGKVRAQDAGVRAARGEIIAFSDANATWEAGALRRLVAPFGDRRVGYVCGTVELRREAGVNQEGVYWRYELMLRRLESELRSVTGGNGAIYAVRREAYIEVDPVMGHDLSFPFNMVKRGWLALYVPEARSSEKMVPSIDGEFARKRRMMAHTWPIVVRGGLLSPRGYDPLYGFMIFSHRVLRYASPFLHVLLLAASLVLIGEGRLYEAAAVAQLLVLAAALAAPRLGRRPLLIARYYVLTSASVAAGLLDWLRDGVDPGWEPAEGTR